MRRERHAPPFPPFSWFPALAFILGLGCAASENTLPSVDPARYLAGQTTFPEEIWQGLEDLEGAGWDVEALAAAKARFEELESGALVAVHRGLVVAHQVATGGLGLASQARRRIFGSPEVKDAEIGGLISRIARAAPEN